MKNNYKYSVFMRWKPLGIRSIYIVLVGTSMFISCIDNKSSETGEEIIESITTLHNEYKDKIEELDKNEYQSLKHYNDIRRESNAVFLDELNQNIIPKWEKNISILKELITSDYESPEKREEFKRRLKYSELRLEAFILIEKAVTEDTDKYNDEINAFSLEIIRAGESIIQ